jgi:hypothetical protein
MKPDEPSTQQVMEAMELYCLGKGEILGSSESSPIKKG